jgi:precorrin-3B synthase
MCSFAPPSVLPDISPTRGEITPVGFYACFEELEIWTAVSEGPISPLVGEMSGRTEGGATGHGRSRSNVFYGLG